MALGDRTLLDRGDHGAPGDGHEAATDGLSGVDEVGADVAQGARAHGTGVAPGHRGGGVAAVVAPVAGVDVVDLAQVAGVDQLLDLGHGRVAAVGEAGGGDDLGVGGLGLGHGLGVLEGVSQGLLTQDVLASADHGFCDLAVQGVADDDGDHVDTGVVSDVAPVGDGLLIAVALGGVDGEGFVGVGDGGESDLG